MTLYNVHLYREMRLFFPGVEADTAAQAALRAAASPTSEAQCVEDCEGENLATLVDVVADESYAVSVTIDFETERLREAAPELPAACRMVVDRWEEGDLAEAARACAAAIKQAMAA